MATRSDQVIQNLIDLQAQGRFADLESGAQALVRSNPRNVIAWYLVGVGRAGQKRYQDALQAYGEALKLNGRNPFTLLAAGMALRMLGRYGEAAATLERAIECDPRSIQAYQTLAAVHTATRNPEAALRCYEQACELEPDNAQVHNDRGAILESLGRLSDARRAYDRAIELAPGSALAYYNLGNVLQRLGDYENAIDCYERALTEQPEHLAARTNLGAAQLQLGRHREGLANKRRGSGVVELSAHHDQPQILD